MSDVKTSIVVNSRDLKSFVNFPWKVYEKRSLWVPPLKREVYRLLDVKKHPFWRFSDQILILARRGADTIGRIAGIVDHNYNRYHGEKGGIWGFFECVDDVAAAKALFSAVKTWAAGKGMTFLRGPLNPSTNYEAGLLVEGFEHRPTLMMTYNPPYYAGFVESSGYEKEKDLLSFFVDGNYQPPHWIEAVSSRVKKDMNAWARPVHPKEFVSEAALIRRIYHEAWSENWGFVPTTEDEFRWIAKSVERVIEEDLAFFVYCGEEPVGFALILPDINPLLKRLNGKIGLSGLWKILRHKKEINGTRGFMFGIKKQYQEVGLPAVALDHLLGKIGKDDKFQYFEFGWTLEDNDAINQWLMEGGMRVRNRYRIFRKNF
ncbi:MAG: acyl-CoA N-acyltransferase [Deltaproteobacteria bacterium]|nr:acyl-CoA N-acyltransferase [Deltaproteobacteria bacterium]